jgi:diguanylate cyclase (GGDEF)-like protein
MDSSIDFYKAIIDAITEHIVVIDQSGLIHYVNKSWIEFGIENDYLVLEAWHTLNYLEVCDTSASGGELYSKEAADGILLVISGVVEYFHLEYPCHSPTEKRWFMMRVTPLDLEENQLYVISHQNISERKLAEEAVLSLSRVDSLTGVANRRYFDEFLHSEWKRCARLQFPLSLILLDIDHFKLFNDTYGHVDGDICLKEIGSILQMFGKRPGDISARYGGEKFAVVLGNTLLNQSSRIAHELHDAICNRAIPFKCSPVSSVVTVSMGVAMMYPQQGMEAASLIGAADALLYSAKKNGRNRIEFG